ncbi:putative P-type ATPase [Hesseltinella vesiculosa]|uniref:Cation-transporting ATPase n=1 Tax=Hesseltinella vesiculosa TaxID=101127 RepID=A0A1X2GUU2_9FUNG|nr:putative P-type ATPase [Hesseltinella vesiculosa]
MSKQPTTSTCAAAYGTSHGAFMTGSSANKARRDSAAPLIHSQPIPSPSISTTSSPTPLIDGPTARRRRRRSSTSRHGFDALTPVNDSDDGQSSSEDDDDDDDQSDDDKTLLLTHANPTSSPEHMFIDVEGESCRWLQALYLEEEDVHVNIRGYRFHPVRHLLYRLGVLLTFGAVWLLGRWMPTWWIHWVGDPVPLKDAHWLVFENQYQQVEILRPLREFYGGTLGSVFSAQQLKREMAQPPYRLEEPLSHLILVDYRYVRLVYHPLLDKFLMTGYWKDEQWTSVKQLKLGLATDKYLQRLSVFGPNLIHIHEKPILKLLTDEVLNPFYVFQIGSIILWSLDNYYYYAFCIFLISAFSIIQTLLETKQTLKRTQDMARFECPVRAFRNGSWRMISSVDLVPGDLMDINELALMPCDAMLVSGDCILNESMLTGESVPVAKFPLTDLVLRKLNLGGPSLPAEQAKHFLFNGTKIVRVRGDNNISATAVVIRTGFNTAKGALVRSMLFPKPNNFQFYRDSFRFIGVLSIIAILGFLVSSINFIRLGIDAKTMVLRALDLITIVVPPALPATMSIGTSFAIHRLKNMGIFCISPPRVNIGGKVDCMCFDKTGTLTEDGLDIHGIQTVTTHADDPTTKAFAPEMKRLPDQIDLTSQSSSAMPTSANSLADMLRAMTTCHSLKIVHGELMGDPLDLKMFEFTGWELEESGTVSSSQGVRKGAKVGIMPTVVRPPGDAARQDNYPLTMGTPHSSSEITPIEFGIIHTFEFVSSLRRMSVIVRQLSSKSMDVFVKGAPEAMLDICTPESIPKDYQQQLYWYTHRGYRVIACAWRQLDGVKWHKLHKLKRHEVECQLHFIGFIIFENKLKPRTTMALTTLRNARIRQIMCTGDNVLTAISVSRECGLVEQQAEIYIPKFTRGSSTEADSALVWESVITEGRQLDSDSLLPRSSSTQYYEHPFGGQRQYYVAVTGEAFRWVVDHGSVDLLGRMLIKGAIYARMSPDEKQELVVALQDLGYCVGFCGDGANDCGALKAGDIGISLSEAEASVAAPFTSNTLDIECVIDVIKQGRAALVTSFSCFKYMALYSLIQFTSVTLLYAFGSNLGDFQFLYIDLFLILPIAVYMGYTDAWPHLYHQQPTASLVSKKVLTSLFGNIIINTGFQFLAYWMIHKQAWYTPPTFDPDGENIACYENTVLFLVSSYQYILVAVVFSVGPPYRQPLWTNGKGKGEGV